MPHDRWRILLVDDDEDEYGLLCDMAEMAQLAIDLAWVGTYAEGLAALDDPAYDAYLVDYRLGDDNGLDLLREARARGVATPIIMLTGAGNASVDRAALVAGAQDYLLKEQINAEVLERALRYAIEHARTLAALQQAHDTLAAQVTARTAELVASNQELQAELAEHWRTVEVVERERREKTALLESAAEGMYGQDLSGRCTFVNRAGAAMLGYAPAELLGQDMHTLVHHHQDGTLYAPESCPIGQSYRGERTVRVDDEVLWRRDGTSFPTEYSSAPLLRDEGIVGAVVVFTDITERQQAVFALARREAQLAEAQRLAHLGSWEWELATNQLTWSDEHFRILGLEPQDAPFPFEDGLRFIHPEDLPRVRAQLDGAIRMGELFDLEYRMLRADGEVRWIHGRGTLRAAAAGQSDRVTGSAHDITDRKRAEVEREQLLASEQAAHADLLQAQSRLIQQERLRALGEMASGIAHDFNNALAPMLGYSELLLARPQLWEDTATTTEYLTLINTGAQDAASVVRRLREFYREREAHEAHQPVHLDKLVEQAVHLTQPRWKDQAQASGRQIRVLTDLLPVSAIDGDAGELREVLTNLIFNAVDALSDGGTITVHTAVEADRVLVAVSDSGTGMPEAVRLRCLEPFFTTKGDAGTGLGLAMVYGIVQRHAGTLAIESVPGQGTTIRLSFPVGLGATGAVVADPLAALTRRLHVLVVDDDDRVRKVTVTYLTSDGHTVETAADGAQGLERFLAGRFDVVLTDWAMPGMAGDQLAVASKRLCPSKPVVLMTGFGATLPADGPLPDGVDAVMSKPATLDELRRVLAAVTRSEPDSRGAMMGALRGTSEADGG
jgi:PAS domain S-box-containing protein